VRLLASIFCALMLCLCLSGGAWGDSVAIQNASFETTNPLPPNCAGTGCAFNFAIPDWNNISSSTAAGSFQPGSNTLYFTSPIPDGITVAFINSGAITQTLGVSLLPNSVYTLSVDVGRRVDVVAANYSLNLLDGSNVFCTSGSNSNGSITAGTFEDITLTCATGAAVPGGFLGIEFTGDGRQTDFDNVRLDVTGSTVSTPEPSVLVLMLTTLGLVGLLFARSRRNHHLQVASS